MISRRLGISFIVLIGSGLFGCAPVDHGRMGVWGRPDFVWANCNCAKPRDENASRAKNMSFDTAGKPCGGDNEKDRNAFCGEKCGSVGYAEGEYKMCMM